jgi:hypothetical protein
MQPVAQAIVCVLVILSVGPVVAVSTLVCVDPARWGNGLQPLAIPVMAVYGLLTTPLWPTYLPVVIATPFIMRRLARTVAFRTRALLHVIAVAGGVGSLVGLFVMAPLIVMQRADPSGQAGAWAMAGATSGAVTSSLVTMLYRRGCEPSD